MCSAAANALETEPSTGLKVKELSTQAHHATHQVRETRRMLALDRPILTPRRVRRLPWAPVGTVLASGVALVAIGSVVFNWLDVYLVFFGEEPQVRPANVAAYRLWGTIVVLAVVGGVLAHLLNRRRRVLGTVWHALLILGGTAILVLCYIPRAVDLPSPERDQGGYGAPPCYSGGDNDECVGG